MTISSTASSVTIQGNGATTAFPYAFLIPGASDGDQTNVVVTVVDQTVTPALTTVLAAGQFTITGVGNAAGGFVNYPLSGAALAAGHYLTIQRVLADVQSTSIPNQSAFYAKVVENSLDYLTMLIQQTQAQVSRALQVAVTDPGGPPATLPVAATRANMALLFDANGNPIAGAVPTAPISAAMLAVVQAATLAAARAAMGLAAIAASGSGADLVAATVTNAKLAQMPANTIKLNNTVAPASPIDGTTDQLLSMVTRPYLDAFIASAPGTYNAHAKINLVARQDNRGWFDLANHRYTPQLAGKYRVTATGHGTYTNSNTLETLIIEIFKNGAVAAAQQLGWNGVSLLPNYNPMTADIILTMNGATDYVEFYLYGLTSDGSPPGILNATLIVEYLGP